MASIENVFRKYNPGYAFDYDFVSEFMILVVLSNLIAIPVATLILKKIFQIFSYSVDLKPLVFVLVFLLSVFLSLITVAYQAFRTARSNPVKSLRYE